MSVASSVVHSAAAWAAAKVEDLVGLRAASLALTKVVLWAALWAVSSAATLVASKAVAKADLSAVLKAAVSAGCSVAYWASQLVVKLAV